MISTKRLATGLLILSLIGMLFAWPYRDYFIGGLLVAACEAAMVGALADWFAVVALFRHPLGLKFIPHTAIIPNSRERIIDGIADMVENDWLSIDFIRTKIYEYPLMDKLANALETEASINRMDQLVQKIITKTLREIAPSNATNFKQMMLNNNLEQINISPEFLEILLKTIKSLYGDDLIRLLLDWAIGASHGTEFEQVLKVTLKKGVADYSKRGNFFRRFSKGLGESLDILNYEEAAKELSHSINKLLRDMKIPGNEYHTRLKKQIQNLSITESQHIGFSISDILKTIVSYETGQEVLVEFIETLVHNISNTIVQYIKFIQKDEQGKVIEARIKTELANLLERYHGVIGRIVREKLAELNDKMLVKSLEDKVGDDLQWIRINGTMIGAMIGALQFVIHYFL